MVRLIKLILQGESTIRRYTYDIQQLFLKFMALQHGHELKLMIDRHSVDEVQAVANLKMVQISK